MLSAALMLDKHWLLTEKKQKIGLQMYTLRHVTNPGSIATILQKISSIGYRELEIFGYSGREKFWGMDPKNFKALLKDNGLQTPAAHIAFENFLTGKDEDELRLICEAAKIVGNKYIVVAWLNEHFRKVGDDYKLIAEKLNKAAIIAGQYGLQLAYHNHDFEFRPLEDQDTGYDILLKNTDRDLVQMELDLFWIVKAGKDPLELFQSHPGRFPLWHIKDLDKNNGSFTEVGSGSIDFAKIFEQRKAAGLRHFFIEQDEVKKEIFESITESFRYVKEKLI